VRAAFLARAHEHPERFRVLDASQPAEQVAADALDRLREYRGTLE
jgi:dTMP kinase